MSTRKVDWSKQSERLWQFLLAHPNQEFPTPELNRIAAGDGGLYVASISKRCHEVKARARMMGYDFLVTRDEWISGQRHTARTLFVPPRIVPNSKVSYHADNAGGAHGKDMNDK